MLPFILVVHLVSALPVCDTLQKRGQAYGKFDQCYPQELPPISPEPITNLEPKIGFEFKFECREGDELFCADATKAIKSAGERIAEEIHFTKPVKVLVEMERYLEETTVTMVPGPQASKNY